MAGSSKEKDEIGGVRQEKSRGGKTWKERGKLIQYQTLSHCTSIFIAFLLFLWEKHTVGNIIHSVFLC